MRNLGEVLKNRSRRQFGTPGDVAAAEHDRAYLQEDEEQLAQARRGGGDGSCRGGGPTERPKPCEGGDRRRTSTARRDSVQQARGEEYCGVGDEDAYLPPWFPIPNAGLIGLVRRMVEVAAFDRHLEVPPATAGFPFDWNRNLA
jgi:hypothetical protein